MPEQNNNVNKHKARELTSLIVIFALSFCLWMLIAIFHTLAIFLDQNQDVITQPKTLILFKYIWIFLPLWLLNCVLAFMIWRRPEQMLTPISMVASIAVMLFIGLPLLTANKVLIMLWFADQPWTLFSQEMKKTSAFVLWVDLFLIFFLKKKI